jgi:glycosyltransferase involved in cell wall biosynthesis
MRIKIYGAPLSISYNLAKFLKKREMDVTLYVDRAPLDKSYRPEWEDEDINYDSCGWIKQVDVRLGNCLFRRKREKEFLRDLRDADILHMQGESNIWASFTDVPYLYHSYGYDLDQMPFRVNSLKSRILAYFLKRSILKANRVLLAPHQKEVLKKLKLNVRTVYVPCPIDGDKYKRRETPLKDRLRKDGNYDFVFFSPTRHEWAHSRPSNKGNDKFIKAFGRFVKSSSKKALLILVEKGDDLDASKALVKKCGLEKYVMWIKPQTKEGLIEFYSASDIVFDQCALGGFGQVFLESMSCGTPTFIYLKGYDGLYDEDPPCVNVSTEDGIFENLISLTENPERLKDVGKKSRNWIMKYHDWRPSTDRFIKMYEEILKSK